jgi:hypothetical protein
MAEDAWASFSSSVGLRFLEAKMLCNVTSTWGPDDDKTS